MPSTRETLVRMLRQAGYDTFTACKEADRVIRDVKAMPVGAKTTFHSRHGNMTITLQCKA